MTPAIYYVLITFLVLNAGLLLFWWWIIYHARKERVYAVLLAKDEPPVFKRVDMKRKFFTFRKHSYNIEKPKIAHGARKYLFYDVKGADPIDLLSRSNSRMPADTYHHILQNEALKALNTVPFGLDLSNKYVRIGLLVVGGILLWYMFGG